MIHYLIVTFIDFFVGVLALTRKQGRSSAGVVACSASLGLWSLELFILSSGLDKELISPWFHLTRWGLFFIAISFAFFAYQLVGNKSKIYRYFVLYPGFIATILLCLANFFVFPTGLKPVEGGFLPERDGIFTCFSILFTYVPAGAVLYCVFSYKRVPDRNKQKIALVLLSLLVTIIFGWIAIAYSAKNSYLSKYVAVVINLIIIFTFLYVSGDHKLANIRVAAVHLLVKCSVLLFFVSIYLILNLTTLPNLDLPGQLLLIFLYALVLTQAYPRIIDFILPPGNQAACQGQL